MITVSVWTRRGAAHEDLSDRGHRIRDGREALLAAGTSVADVVDRWHAETERAIKRSHVVVDLRDGETLRFMVDLHYDELRAGTYSARLHYAVKRNIQGLNVDGSFRHPDQATLTRAKTLWEGTVVSDWITFNVVDAPRSGP